MMFGPCACAVSIKYVYTPSLSTCANTAKVCSVVVYLYCGGGSRMSGR